MAVIGAVDNQETIKTAVSAPPPDKKPKKESKKDTKKVKSPSSTASTSQPTTDDRFNELDNKWSERFSRLEALILAKSFGLFYFRCQSGSVPLTSTDSEYH